MNAPWYRRNCFQRINTSVVTAGLEVDGYQQVQKTSQRLRAGHTDYTNFNKTDIYRGILQDCFPMARLVLPC